MVFLFASLADSKQGVSRLSKRNRVYWLFVSIVRGFLLSFNLLSILESLRKQLTAGLSLLKLLSRLALWQVSKVFFFRVLVTVLSTNEVLLLVHLSDTSSIYFILLISCFLDLLYYFSFLLDTSSCPFQYFLCSVKFLHIDKVFDFSLSIYFFLID